MTAQCAQSNPFPSDQCTFWASKRYQELAGCFVPWSGDAHSWAGQATGFGWVKSDNPSVPSIMCLQAFVQGAFALGHVGVVESINADGSVETSNLNWQPHPKEIVTVQHTVGAGVSFLSSSPGTTGTGNNPPSSGPGLVLGLDPTTWEGAATAAISVAVLALVVIAISVFFIFTA